MQASFTQERWSGEEGRNRYCRIKGVCLGCGSKTRDPVRNYGKSFLIRDQYQAAKCFTAVSDADVNIEMISFGTSTAALYFLVREEKLDVALKALHDIFFD
jgi:hypothetical protein